MFLNSFEIKAQKEAAARNEEFKRRRPVLAEEIANVWKVDYLTYSSVTAACCSSPLLVIEET